MHEADATQSAITTAVTAEQRSAACTMATRCERERARYETTTRYFRWSAGDIRPPKVRTNRNVQRKLWSLFSLRSSFLPRSIIAFPHAYPACLSAYRCAARCSSLSWPSWRWPPWSRLNGSLTSPRVSRINRVRGRSTGAPLPRSLAVRCVVACSHLDTLHAGLCKLACVKSAPVPTGTAPSASSRCSTTRSPTSSAPTSRTVSASTPTRNTSTTYVPACVLACLLACSQTSSRRARSATLLHRTTALAPSSSMPRLRVLRTASSSSPAPPTPTASSCRATGTALSLPLDPARQRAYSGSLTPRRYPPLVTGVEQDCLRKVGRPDGD